MLRKFWKIKIALMRSQLLFWNCLALSRRDDTVVLLPLRRSVALRPARASLYSFHLQAQGGKIHKSKINLGRDWRKVSRRRRANSPHWIPKLAIDVYSIWFLGNSKIWCAINAIWAACPSHHWKMLSFGLLSKKKKSVGGAGRKVDEAFGSATVLNGVMDWP